VTGAEVAIRAAALTDAPAIAALHVAVSQATYRDLAPPETMQRLNLAHRTARWTELLEKGERIALVAERAGKIIGIGSAGAASVPELGARVEILHLYVDPTHARAGIGRALMQALARTLKAQGYNGIALGVVEGNQPAIDFYRKLGGRLAGSYIDPGPLWRSRNQIIIWDDIETLLT
jgi:ribosomal protein S18 acetylase RimI-like enzyme